MTAALIGSAVALAAYALGFWTARHTIRAAFDRHIDTTGLLQRSFLTDARRQRDRYRLAWLSARRRARHARTCHHQEPGRDRTCTLPAGHDGAHASHGNVWWPVPDQSWLDLLEDRDA